MRRTGLLIFTWFFGIAFCTGSGAEKRVPKFLPCPETIPHNMACIPGGTFLLGSNLKDWHKENPELSSLPERKILLSTFLLDKFEVTTSQYKNCVTQKKCSLARSNYPHMRLDNQPQIKVTWFQANAYCIAQGKRLPTEAEFEAASRGPQGEMYPWGNTPADCTVAIIQDNSGRGCLSSANRPAIPARFLSTGTTWPVGSRPSERYGLFDMGGNAQEWVADWYAGSIEKCGASCAGTDPTGPCAGQRSCGKLKEKLTKGGGWYWGAISARASARRPYRPDNNPPHHFGFRCALTVTN